MSRRLKSRRRISRPGLNSGSGYGLFCTVFSTSFSPLLKETRVKKRGSARKNKGNRLHLEFLYKGSRRSLLSAKLDSTRFTYGRIQEGDGRE
jgi:hypothetical protein